MYSYLVLAVRQSVTMVQIIITAMKKQEQWSMKNVHSALSTAMEKAPKRDVIRMTFHAMSVTIMSVSTIACMSVKTAMSNHINAQTVILI